MIIAVGNHFVFPHIEGYGPLPKWICQNTIHAIVPYCLVTQHHLLFLSPVPHIQSISQGLMHYPSLLYKLQTIAYVKILRGLSCLQLLACMPKGLEVAPLACKTSVVVPALQHFDKCPSSSSKLVHMWL